ncbi:MAG: hypothetical protein WDO73_01010 [Ignavibacteriota bacterium]
MIAGATSLEQVKSNAAAANWKLTSSYSLNVGIAANSLASQSTLASVIAGATSVERVKSNAAAANWRLTSGELAELDRLLA